MLLTLDMKRSHCVGLIGSLFLSLQYLMTHLIINGLSVNKIWYYLIEAACFQHRKWTLVYKNVDMHCLTQLAMQLC